MKRRLLKEQRALSSVSSKACSHCGGVLDVQSGIAGAPPAATIETAVKRTSLAEKPCGSAAAQTVCANVEALQSKGANRCNPPVSPVVTWQTSKEIPGLKALSEEPQRCSDQGVINYDALILPTSLVLKTFDRFRCRRFGGDFLNLP